MGHEEQICTGIPVTKSFLVALLALAVAAVSPPNTWFVSLFIFRYLRLVVHIFSFNFMYEMTSIPNHPTVHPSDCTIILPTIDPSHVRFSRNLESVLKNVPDSVFIVTVGKSNLRLLEAVVAPLQHQFPQTTIRCLQIDIANKRHQVSHAVPLVETPLTVLLDDSVYWPSTSFLGTVVAPFESQKVGCVGTHKRVVRDTTGSCWQSFFNFLGCVYLERHNFEIRATNAIDGGVFVVSGRTSLIQSQILQDVDFISGFTNERFCWDIYGPLNADDDNFITRWLINRGWDIKVQYGDDSTIETHLGTYPRFFSQVLRWTRTTWRSNPRALFVDRTIWYRHPWCTYAVYLNSLVHFALFYDAALMYTLTMTSFYTYSCSYYMAAWILASKMVKLFAHFRRCPGDVMFIPGYVIFAYCHSLIKLYALFTFYETTWSGRNLAAVKSDEVSDGEESEDGSEDGSESSSLPAPSIMSGKSIKSSGSSYSSRSSVTSDGTNSPAPGYGIRHDNRLGANSHVTQKRHSAPESSSTRSRRQPIVTPWGKVKGGIDASAISASVLESRLSSRSSSPARSTSSTRFGRPPMQNKNLQPLLPMGDIEYSDIACASREGELDWPLEDLDEAFRLIKQDLAVLESGIACDAEQSNPLCGWAGHDSDF